MSCTPRDAAAARTSSSRPSVTTRWPRPAKIWMEPVSWQSGRTPSAAMTALRRTASATNRSFARGVGRVEDAAHGRQEVRPQVEGQVGEGLAGQGLQGPVADAQGRPAAADGLPDAPDRDLPVLGPVPTRRESVHSRNLRFISTPFRPGTRLSGPGHRPAGRPASGDKPRTRIHRPFWHRTGKRARPGCRPWRCGRGFYLRHGFKLDKRWGALVKTL